MNVSKGHNVFSDIPGFDASKGERIVKALQKLWKKVDALEQIRISERKSKTEETQTSSKDDDLTITDVQYKLLILQLQYVRSILRRKLDENDAILHTKPRQDNEDRNVSNETHLEKGDYHKATKSTSLSQATQTTKNVFEEPRPSKHSGITKDAAKRATQVATDYSFKPEDSLASVSAINKTTSSKPHYHLKLDDVPFILGASSTASHSVVANVQNIIAMMKSHNKVLCGSRHHATKPSAVNTHVPVENSQETTNMLNELSQDLYELAIKQQKLVRNLDAAQGNTQALNLTKKDDKKHGTYHGCRRLRSNSESEIKLHAEVKNCPRKKEKNIVKSNIQQKQNYFNVRSQPSNLSIMDRRKLLRSLQNFKSHLSEDDISWD